jgi:hypothetical protein
VYGGRALPGGAIIHVQTKHRICAREAEAALMKALPPSRRRSPFATPAFALIAFNDRCKSFARIASLIARARAIAVAAEPQALLEREAEARQRRRDS